MPSKQILATAEQLEQITTALAQKISAAYRNRRNAAAVVMLEGARRFASDLLAKLDFPMDAVYVKASSYYGGTISTGLVRIEGPQDLPERIRGNNILLIDDIYDTGRTMAAMLARLSEYHPESIKTCVLLEKNVPHIQNIPLDFIGLTVEDAFIVGYGLDYNGSCRELPYIAALSGVPAAEM